MKKFDMKKTRKSSERGMGLLGILLTMAFAITATAVIFQQYNKAQNDQKTEATIRQINTIQTVVANLWGDQPTYGAAVDMEATLAQSQQLPNSMIAPGNVLKSDFNGDLAVVSNADGSLWSITYTGLPSSSCVAIASKDYGQAVYSIVVAAGSAATPANGATCTNSATTKCGTSFSPTEVTTACGSSNGNSVSLTLY